MPNLNIVHPLIRGKNVGIQYLRAICAVIVYLFHYVKAVNWNPVNDFRLMRWSFIVDGSIAVAIFFVLSGFFYCNTKSFTVERYFNGIQRKVLHIYPAHIIILLFGMLFANCHLEWNVSCFTEWGNKFWNYQIMMSDFLKSASCLFIKDAENQINPSAWYLEYEVWLFLIMPLIIGVINKVGWKYSWGLLALGLFALFTNQPMYSLIYLVAVCCIGTLARYITQKNELKFLQNKIVLVIWICIAVFLLAHVYLGAGKIYMFFRGIGAAMIVIVFWKYNFDEIKKVKWLEFLGNISFEFYIVQHIALLAFRPLFVNPIIYFVSTLTFTVVVAWWLNKYISTKAVKL